MPQIHLHSSIDEKIPLDVPVAHSHRYVVLRATGTGTLEELLPTHTGPYQFAYFRKKSTEDAVSMALHSVLTHLDNN